MGLGLRAQMPYMHVRPARVYCLTCTCQVVAVPSQGVLPDWHSLYVYCLTDTHTLCTGMCVCVCSPWPPSIHQNPFQVRVHWPSLQNAGVNQQARPPPTHAPLQNA